MTQKKPNVIKAIVVNIDHSLLSSMYIVRTVGDNSGVYLYYVSASNMPGKYADKQNVTQWHDVGGFVAYVAFGDYVVQTYSDKDAILDQATAKHLNDYKMKAEARLATKKRLAEIQQQMATINSINSESVQDIEQAKKTLLDALNTKAKDIRQSLYKHR